MANETNLPAPSGDGPNQREEIGSGRFHRQPLSRLASLPRSFGREEAPEPEPVQVKSPTILDILDQRAADRGTGFVPYDERTSASAHRRNVRANKLARDPGSKGTPLTFDDYHQYYMDCDGGLVLDENGDQVSPP
ncbi:hypothetical protein [Methylobacterium mesophilicum]|uniref:hypothetical protein n=1 Tax=Methylobacterium mesophilicum TaxID=39956 RepID=UPI002F2D380D